MEERREGFRKNRIKKKWESEKRPFYMCVAPICQYPMVRRERDENEKQESVTKKKIELAVSISPNGVKYQREKGKKFISTQYSPFNGIHHCQSVHSDCPRRKNTLLRVKLEYSGDLIHTSFRPTNINYSYFALVVIIFFFRGQLNCESLVSFLVFLLLVPKQEG